jgi:hypothetical protein
MQLACGTLFPYPKPTYVLIHTVDAAKGPHNVPTRESQIYQSPHPLPTKPDLHGSHPRTRQTRARMGAKLEHTRWSRKRLHHTLLRQESRTGSTLSRAKRHLWMDHPRRSSSQGMSNHHASCGCTGVYTCLSLNQLLPTLY